MNLMSLWLGFKFNVEVVDYLYEKGGVEYVFNSIDFWVLFKSIE